ncbi:DNA polymerase III subunit delta [Thermoactinomyces sp. CICC 10521]|uniref:DNA polymerase III subunit delta n=2 Tax=Thermoactinomycetaceae TaxID=186824 RepID=A0A7W1X9W7_9BACL|nr:DNA polymerase III subunit delta [Thermoactinomyces daqus]MBH8602916.1 DNA polymerase III subunit delta [Thermoactinomyces sp. CICC 10522]MBH8607236.1 DNA polymerase III subunit delta [Thermoactinomyces sp. CICC 10521]
MAKMDRSWLKEWQEDNIAPVYLFYGEEGFLIEEAIEWMKKRWSPEEVSFGNLMQIDLDETPVQMLVQEAETLPFFGDRRLIIGQNARFLTAGKGKSGVQHETDALLQYLKQPLSTSVVVLTVSGEQLDKRKKIVKELLKHARAVEFPLLAGKDLLQWVERRFAKLHVQADPQAVLDLIMLTGPDLRLLHAEVSKLALYVGAGGKVTPDIVAELVPRTLEHDVFKLTDKIAKRQLNEAFHIWSDLIFQKEEPIRILALITRQIRLMLQVKILQRQGMSDKEMAAFLKVHPYPVKLAAKQGAAFSEQQLRLLLDTAILTDQDIKSGKVDKHLAVERLLFQVNLSA